MASMEIQFAKGTIKTIAVGKQLITAAIDLGGHYRVLDLNLNVYGQTGSITVAVITGMSNDLDIPWATLGSFGQVTTTDGSARQVMVGALRYVRFEVTQLTGVAYWTLDGYARTTL